MSSKQEDFSKFFTAALQSYENYTNRAGQATANLESRANQMRRVREEAKRRQRIQAGILKRMNETKRQGGT